jgi:hypothetical protein
LLLSSCREEKGALSIDCDINERDAFSMTTKTNSGICIIFLLLPAVALGQVPTITSFSPTYGPIGTTVTITGTNFSTTPGNNIIYFGAVRATVTAATSTSLTITVPAGATYQPITVTANGLTAYSRAPFIATFTGGGAILSCSFLPKVDFATDLYPKSVAIGDFDGDGTPDMAVAYLNSNIRTVAVFRNTSLSGSISFAPKVDLNTGRAPGGLAIGDLDGDGKLDLVVANVFDGTVSVFRNTSTIGSISFASRVDSTTAIGPSSIVIVDLDGDGKPDLVVASGNTNTVSALRNTSTGGSISFAPKVEFTTASPNQDICISDLDGDGKPGLVVASAGVNPTVSVFRNTSTTGSLSFALRVDLTGISPWSVAAGDLDSDGKPEIAVTGVNPVTGSRMVAVFRNTSTPGNISFASRVDFATSLMPYGVAIGDLDGDGIPDLAVAGASDNLSLSVFRNTSTSGNISFASRMDFTTGITPYGVAVGDLDGDGKPDLAVANYSSSTVSVVRNAVGARPYPPNLASPFNGATSVPTSVTLTWDAPCAATSYRVQLAADSSFLIGVVVDDSTLTQSSLGVTGLTNNTKYYWRVNAKNSGGTSTFSGRSSFTTIAPAPNAPGLFFPPNASTNQPTTLVLGWNSAPGATRYQLQAATDSHFVTGIILNDSTLTDTLRAVTGLAKATRYYWHVNAKNAGGTSAWSSTWDFSTADVTFVEKFGSEIPVAFSLHQNYPNPFNPSTKIEFALPKSSFASLQVYDVFGRRVAELVNETLEAGTYRAQWHAGGFASGVYFYRLQVGPFSQTKKLVLVR